MPSSPQISVLIPCYNQARYLPQAIESVLTQENADWELIISDDASKDNSAEIIRAAAARDPRIHVQLHTANLGMAANWNWCLQNARGQYVKYLFGDDYHCDNAALHLLASALDVNSDAVLATSTRLIVDKNSQTLSISDSLGTDGIHPGRKIVTRCLLAGKNLIGEPSAVMFRRSAADRLFDPAYRQLIDLEFYAHLLEHGDLAYITRPLCAFRRHDEQQTATNRRTHAGESEGLILQLKYLPLTHRYLTEGGSRHAVRRAFFRNIYFARKSKERSATCLANERNLMQELTPLWYSLYWVHHRLTKPLSNLASAIKRSGFPART